MRTAHCLVLIVLLALSACADEASQVADPTATPGADTNRREQPTDWYLRSISKDGRTIEFVYQMSGVASGCERESEPTIEESDERVLLIANKSLIMDRARACTEELAYIDQSVKLKVPLRDRALVGCRTGKTAPSEDRICRDLDRSRDAGIFEFSPAPS